MAPGRLDRDREYHGQKHQFGADFAEAGENDLCDVKIYKRSPLFSPNAQLHVVTVARILQEIVFPDKFTLEVGSFS